MLTFLIVYLVIGLIVSIADGIFGWVVGIAIDPPLAYFIRVILWPIVVATTIHHGAAYYRNKRRIK